MIVHITEKKSGRLAATIPGVVVRGQNYQPTRQDVENVAWQCAVQDGSVDAARRDEYAFTFENEPRPLPPKSWS